MTCMDDVKRLLAHKITTGKLLELHYQRDVVGCLSNMVDEMQSDRDKWKALAGEMAEAGNKLAAKVESSTAGQMRPTLATWPKAGVEYVGIEANELPEMKQWNKALTAYAQAIDNLNQGEG